MLSRRHPISHETTIAIPTDIMKGCQNPYQLNFTPEIFETFKMDALFFCQSLVAKTLTRSYGQ
jgi:hypothetical protein